MRVWRFVSNPSYTFDCCVVYTSTRQNHTKINGCQQMDDTRKKSEFAHTGLDFIWGDNIDVSINYFQELKVQKRQQEDVWYASIFG